MTIRNSLLAGAALAAIAFASVDANAANVSMCQGDVSGATTGTRTIGGTLSAVPSGTLYVLNGQGCGLIASGDVGYFQSIGFTQASSQQSIVFTTGVATGTTDFLIGTLPAKAYIQQIIFSNAVAASVTGGISIGSSANGTQIVTAQSVGSSADIAVSAANITLPVSATGVATPLHMAAVTAWNSTNVTVTVVYGAY